MTRRGLGGWLEASAPKRAASVLAADPADPDDGEAIGRSREGRPLRAYRFGRGSRRVSLIAGCHADEPVGPRLLRRLCGYLAALPADDPLLADVRWWIIPHLNPDGAVRNRTWQPEGAEAYDLPSFLLHVVREAPGDDVEFAFPRETGDEGARPEARAARRWWGGASGPFDLHASLHGMAFGAGPWFLVDAAWRDRCERLKRLCAARARELGYELHDVERRGEKGFERLERGFATRPDSRAMKAYFLGRGDPETAARFRPSSMETVRSLGGDALTLVSEVPLFLTPGVGRELGPPDPAAEAWRERMEGWRARLHGAAEEDTEAVEAEGPRVREEARAAGLRPVPARDQMALQWALVAAGLEQVEVEAARR